MSHSYHFYCSSLFSEVPVFSPWWLLVLPVNLTESRITWHLWGLSWWWQQATPYFLSAGVDGYCAPTQAEEILDWIQWRGVLCTGGIHCSLLSNCECHDQLLWAPATMTSTGWTVPWIDPHSLKLLLLQQQQRNWHEVFLLSCILKNTV